MKAYALALLALVVVVGAAIGWVALRPVGPTAVPPAPPKPAAAFQPPASKPIVAPPPMVRVEKPEAPSENENVAALPADPAIAKERVVALSSVADPAAVPQLAAYLSHADAGVRRQAATGLVMLGDPSGVGFLTAAAERAEKSPALAAEAAALRAAAELLANSHPEPATLPPPDAGAPVIRTPSAPTPE